MKAKCSLLHQKNQILIKLSKMGVLDYYLKNSQLYFYGIAIFVAIFRYPKYFDTPLRFFPIFLMYTFLNELFAYLIHNGSNFFNPFLKDIYEDNNLILYNFYNIIFFTYFFYIYWHFTKTQQYKNYIKYAGYSFLIVAVINIIYQNFFTEQQIITFTYGSTILISGITLYLKEHKSILRKKIIKYSLLFWLSIGLLIFHFFYIPIKVYYNFTDFKDINLFYNIKRVHLFLICIMYSFFIYGFIQTKGKLKV
jgi:hypothetical protein